MSNRKRPRWEDEMLVGVHVNDDIICKDCAFRSDGTVWTNHHTKGSCQKYPYPQHKPMKILFNSAKCTYYKKD